MNRTDTQIIVAGHICLDLIPDFHQIKGDFKTILSPGKLINVGPVTISTGGPVSNTGLALHRLGISTQLMGKVGDDYLGEVILKHLESYDPELAAGMIVTSGNHTAYTIVISSQQIDRMFLHHSGANDTFTCDDIVFDKMKAGKIFHFGYPPLMRQFYVNDGKNLETLMQRAKQSGFVTSMDMAFPDPSSEGGQVDWRTILERTLPLVDIFLPSLDEMAFLLKYARSDETILSDIGDLLLDMGANIVVLKLGDQGLYLKTTSVEQKLAFLKTFGYQQVNSWIKRELISTCFKVEVAGTTGAGDSTIAGFLTALINQFNPVDTMTSAVAVGACNVEAMDALSGVPRWEEVQQRIQQGWEKHPLKWHLPGWRYDEVNRIWVGPDDGNR